MTLSIPRIVAGAVLVILGVGWLLQTAGIVHFDSNLIAPIALIGIGVALVAGSPRGLHVPLFIAGIVLTAVLAGDTTHVRVTTSVRRLGDVSYVHPTDALELRPFDQGVGKLTVDLTGMPLNGETYRVSAHVGTGRLEIVVPNGVTVQVDAKTGVGNSNVFGRHSSGAGTHSFVNIAYPDRTKFVIRARVGAGSIVVRHASPDLMSRPSGTPQVTNGA